MTAWLKCGLLVSIIGIICACDDTIFGGGEVALYPPGWVGVTAMMEDHCVGCHPALEEPDLIPDIRADVLDGTGVYVVPGDPENSYLWTIINGSDPDYFMPLGFSEPLPLTTIQHVEQWILDGAVIPEGQ